MFSFSNGLSPDYLPSNIFLELFRSKNLENTCIVSMALLICSLFFSGDISYQTTIRQYIASFVMILGYGITSVPTDIVFAEIGKSNFSRVLNKNNPCPECGTAEYPENAKFCPKCGHSINTK